MEFFAIADIPATQERLQLLTALNMPHYCADIDKVLHAEDENRADVYCTWGEFTVERQLIQGGVRFSLPECPNALAWTITTGYAPAPDRVVIHCTINRMDHDEDFIESIHSFVDAYKVGLESALSAQAVS